MDIQRLNSFLITLSLSVFGFGIITWASIVPDRTTSASTERSPSSVPEATLLNEITRRRPTFKNHLVTVDLSCKSKKLEARKIYVVNSSFVQLNGKNCIPKRGFKAINISNQTNGFQAAFFNTGHSQYKTDLIQLSEGKNKIQIEYVHSGGHKTEFQLYVTSR